MLMIDTFFTVASHNEGKPIEIFKIWKIDDCIKITKMAKILSIIDNGTAWNWFLDLMKVLITHIWYLYHFI